jgi:hypothetical protein
MGGHVIACCVELDCGGFSYLSERVLEIQVGPHAVMAPIVADVCSRCGEYTLSSGELNFAELRAVAYAFGNREVTMTGFGLEFARKALGVKREVLASLIPGYTAESIELIEREDQVVNEVVRGAVLELLRLRRALEA